MALNPLQQLRQHGQSPWLDNIDRTLLTGGELQRLVERGEILGVTSNPTIFQKAITTCSEYDPIIRAESAAGRDTFGIWEAISTADISDAADILAPVYRQTQGQDGYVSIEVAPSLAHDLWGTVREAQQLFRNLGHPNIMIKVPATPEGVSALEELIATGVNVNATLIFSPDNYEQVARAYIRGIERLVAGGGALDRVASVASFFVSRLDTAIDKLLEARMQQNGANRDLLQGLLGKAAIANAKIAYERFRRLFAQEPFLALQKRGARVQRPLWASTSTKNPAYRDVMYVEELIGPHTVNTMPPATLDAFRDHGRVRDSLEEDIARAHQVFADLEGLGIDLPHIFDELQAAGIQAFAESFAGLLGCIRERQGALRPA